MAIVKWDPRLVRTIRNKQYNEQLRGPRVGVMLHYDGSGNDKGGVEWFAHPDCRVSYNWLVLDDGTYVEIAPPSARAWHAGLCSPRNPDKLAYVDGNSAFYAISAATNDRVDVTPLQLMTIAYLTWRCFTMERWSLTDLHRIVGHSSEAVNKDGTRRRKVDPEGPEWWERKSKNPIFTPDDVRQLLPLVQT
jgi:N-acetyl-anhydromuramyl-L-alanine amidase AmpD